MDISTFYYTECNKSLPGYFCIKLRSDDYPILDPVINILKRNRDKKDEKTGLYQYFKIVTSNIYFRFDRENKFHPSDHIIAGQKIEWKIFYKGTTIMSTKALLDSQSNCFSHHGNLLRSNKTN